MIVELQGHNLPGRRCRPNPQGEGYENVHVGPGSRGQAIELVAGDANEAYWTIEVRLIKADDGSLDFRGPLVEGKRGDRFLYLNWGTIAPDSSFSLFRRAKISLSEVPAELVDRALAADNRITARVDLTDAKGNPLCARVRPPYIGWSVLPSLGVRRIRAWSG
jgi:hypothetical protein